MPLGKAINREPGAPSPMLVTLTGDDLARIVREQVDAALDERAEDHAPARLLVSGAEFGQLLGCSRGKVHQLRCAGMPSVKVGDVYKFEPQTALTWLRARSAKDAG